MLDCFHGKQQHLKSSQLLCGMAISHTTVHNAVCRYAVPKQLAQWRLVVPAQHKPLALLGLLHQLAGSSTIVFASSLETTHR
jgi:superfamily II DNA/RNA helicase